jgi:hypothetical protein
MLKLTRKEFFLRILAAVSLCKVPEVFEFKAIQATSSPGLIHLQTAYFKKKALDRLQAKFRFRDASSVDLIPHKKGETVEWYRYYVKETV